MNAQREAALAKANEVRLGVAARKRQLRDGEVTFGELLRDPSCRPAKVRVLLAAQRQWGPRRAERLMTHFGLSAEKRVGDLTERQVDCVARAVQMPERSWWQLQRRIGEW